MGVGLVLMAFELILECPGGATGLRENGFEGVLG